LEAAGVADEMSLELTSSSSSRFGVRAEERGEEVFASPVSMSEESDASSLGCCGWSWWLYWIREVMGMDAFRIASGLSACPGSGV